MSVTTNVVKSDPRVIKYFISLSLLPSIDVIKTMCQLTDEYVALRYTLTNRVSVVRWFV